MTKWLLKVYLEQENDQGKKRSAFGEDGLIPVNGR